MRQENQPNNRSFMFLAHFVETWNWLLRWSKDLNQNPHHVWRWRWLWPLCAAVSVLYLIGRKPYEVGRFCFAGLPGEICLLRNFGWHFFLKSQRARIRQRILKAVLDAQDRGISVIGLGALTKAEWLTAGGQWLVDTLGERLRVPIVHGDTLTAAAVIYRTLELIQRVELQGRPVFITGATSKIGRAVVLALAARGVQVVMDTRSRKRFNTIRAEAGEHGHLLAQAPSLCEGARCGLWITGKAVPGGKALLQHVPHGAVVLNFSVPDPLSSHLLRRRPDVHHVDGGLLGYSPERTTLWIPMRLRPGVTYACHAGTIVHAYRGWAWHEVGPVDMEFLPHVWEAAQELGFFLPAYTSFGHRKVLDQGGTNHTQSLR